MCGNDFLQASHLCSFPFCFHLVVHLRAIGTVSCTINKVGSQPLPPSPPPFFWGGVQVFFSVLITPLYAEYLTWMEKQFELFCLFAYVNVPRVFLFFLQSYDSIAFRERVSQILCELLLYFKLYMFSHAGMG